MLSLAIHFTERVVRFFSKAVHRSSLLLDSVMSSLAQRLNRRSPQSLALSDSVRTETQVQSLSSLAVLLLAIVITLTFWATNLQGSSDGAIQFLSLGDSSIGQSPENSNLEAQPSVSEDSQPLRSSGTLAFSMSIGGQDDLFALSSGKTEPTRLTDSPADDRDPVWSPDGRYLAFASKRDGNWELYTAEMSTGSIKRLTFDLAYESAPTWSPDGQWIAYESYTEGNLNIYLIKSDATEGPYPVTRSAAADFMPRWTTAEQGRTIAYVSTRSGNQDIYLISLDDPNEDRAINLTNTSELQEQNPVWSPDGTQIVYSAIENGIPLLYVRSVTDLTAPPKIIGQGFSAAWSPDGQSLAYLKSRPSSSTNTGDLLLISQATANETPAEAVALPATAQSLTWTDASLPSPQGSLAFAATSPLPEPYQEPLVAPVEDSAQVRMINLSSIVAESPNLSDRVDGSFSLLRDHVNRAAGWDFLGRLDNVWWPLNRPVEPGQDPNNWHKAGRAFDIVQAYNQGNPPQIELVREDIGADTFWRLYIRAAVQDGSLGEPLHSLPWNFSARTSGNVQAYENGGQLKTETPSGYYVDFTELAATYGWTRAASDITWKYNWPGVAYWQYEKRDNLDWWAAMLELYPQAALEAAVFTATPAPTTRALTPTATVDLTPARESSATLTPSPTPTRTPGAEGN